MNEDTKELVTETPVSEDFVRDAMSAATSMSRPQFDRSTLLAEAVKIIRERGLILPLPLRAEKKEESQPVTQPA